jgi:hypothetical protein
MAFSSLWCSVIVHCDSSLAVILNESELVCSIELEDLWFEVRVSSSVDTVFLDLKPRPGLEPMIL